MSKETTGTTNWEPFNVLAQRVRDTATVADDASKAYVEAEEALRAAQRRSVKARFIHEEAQARLLRCARGEENWMPVKACASVAGKGTPFAGVVCSLDAGHPEWHKSDGCSWGAE